MNRIIRVYTSFTLLIHVTRQIYKIQNMFTFLLLNVTKSKKRSSTAHRAASAVPSFLKASKINLAP